jgi:molybdopterin/thiamine biosynthesis adenylyltransferase
MAHPGDPIVIEIPDTAGDRYATFGFISWWEQKRVRDATAMIVGAGALGNEVAKALALMGIGRLFIVDFDTVETGNLSRSALFRAEDSGRQKAETLAQAVKRLNPDVAVQAFHGDLNYELGLGVLRRMDVIIGCLDNRLARLSLNRFCWELNKPWVDGAIETLLGYARVFWPGKGACYECGLTSRDYELINMRLSCGLLARANLLQGKVPTTPTAAAIVGGVQAQEALKILHGLPVEPGVSLVFNGLTNDYYKTRLPVREDCLSHASLDEIVELPEATAESSTLAQLLAVARSKLGSQASLSLGFDLVISLYCRHCDTRSDVLRPLHLLTEAEAQCPICKEFRTPEVLNEFERDDQPVAHLPLHQLGVPRLAILSAYLKERVIGLELSGDVAASLNFQ